MLREISDAVLNRLDALLGRPEVQAIQAEEDRQTLEQRRAWSAELKVKREAHDEAYVAEEAALRPLEDALLLAKDAWRRAEEQLQAQQASTFVARFDRENAINRLRGKLRPNALIDALAAETSDLIHATYQSSQTYYQENIEGRQIVAWTNHDQVAPRVHALRAILEALSESGDLRYKGLSDEELRERYDRMRRTVPALPSPPAHVLNLPANQRPVWVR